MDEDSVLSQDREDSSSGEVKFSDGGQQCSSQRASDWRSLPDLCLRHVFRCLSDRDRMSANLVCHHWYDVMHSPSLWRSRVFHFSGQLSRYRQSEYHTAVAYARSLGVYLRELEVFVHPPRRSMIARRLEQTITGLFSELTKVKPPLRCLSLVKLELDRPAWSAGVRDSLVNCLTGFFRRGSSNLTTIRLCGMHNQTYHGLELLSALSFSQRHLSLSSISSLELRGFFSPTVSVHRNISLPNMFCNLRGLTTLQLSYSCLSDELLMALQHTNRRRRQSSSRDVVTLQMLSLHCTFSEYHQQVVSGASWASLASSCPDLKVKFRVDLIINTDLLERILLPEIPLVDYAMTAFYSPDDLWSAKPVLSTILPQYRSSLQYLTLDLTDCGESLDEELLDLVSVCEHLKDLRVWAFLEIHSVEGLLQIRLTRRSLLNKIRVRIYSMQDNMNEQEDKLEEMLSSHGHLPPELDFFAVIYPFE